MAEGQTADHKRIPGRWKKITKPMHIQTGHVFPAFNTPPDIQPLQWDFPPQETSVVQLHPV